MGQVSPRGMEIKRLVFVMAVLSLPYPGMPSVVLKSFEALPAWGNAQIRGTARCARDGFLFASAAIVWDGR